MCASGGGGGTAGMAFCSRGLPLSRHRAGVTADAGGFQPAGDTADVRLVNALYCRSVPEITAPSLGELF